MRFCGLETDGKLLEDAGDKVLGDPLLELLPPPPPHGRPPPVIKGRNGGSLELFEAALEFVEAVVVVVKGLVLFGHNELKRGKSISRKNFLNQIPFFAFSKMAKYQFLNWEIV